MLGWNFMHEKAVKFYQEALPEKRDDHLGLYFRLAGCKSVDVISLLGFWLVRSHLECGLQFGHVILRVY